MLIGNDTFRRGLRRGVEQGEYVYRRGELLYGPGDPAASIEIDEQSIVFTMAYARNTGIWPRPKPERPSDSDDDKPGGRGDGGDAVGEETGPQDDSGQPPGPAQTSFSKEGVLKDALTQLWEEARSRGVDRIGALTIRMFESGDAFRLLGAVGAVPGADKQVTIQGGYETRDGGSFELEFRGPVPDAQPVREFLQPQLRDAASTDIQAGFKLTFADGLAMKGDAAEKLTERLVRFASGAAYVTATAEAKFQ